MTFALNRPPEECGIVDNRPLFWFVISKITLLVFSYGYYVFAYARNWNNIRTRALEIEKQVFSVELYELYIRTMSEAVETAPAKTLLLVFFFAELLYTVICFSAIQFIGTVFLLDAAFLSVAFQSYRKIHHQLSALPFIMIVVLINVALAMLSTRENSGTPGWVFPFMISVQCIFILFFIVYPCLSMLVARIKDKRTKKICAEFLSKGFVLSENSIFISSAITALLFRVDHFEVKRA